MQRLRLIVVVCLVIALLIGVGLTILDHQESVASCKERLKSGEHMLESAYKAADQGDLAGARALLLTVAGEYTSDCQKAGICAGMLPMLDPRPLGVAEMKDAKSLKDVATFTLGLVSLCLNSVDPDAKYTP